ncbi:hypothetical protein JTB14_030331 [Gonioctena quinquepunctata]|nr:hypothetical protein JTB14_030331 [Gonioctena quinquepunctata]
MQEGNGQNENIVRVNEGEYKRNRHHLRPLHSEQPTSVQKIPDVLVKVEDDVPLDVPEPDVSKEVKNSVPLGPNQNVLDGYITKSGLPQEYDDVMVDEQSNASFSINDSKDTKYNMMNKSSGSNAANVTTSGSQSFLTPSLEKEWPDVIKMNDYLNTGRRQQFWEEPFTKRVMDAIKTKSLEMKVAAELLGVSYGTLYGRYRDSYGCLKHPYR